MHAQDKNYEVLPTLELLFSPCTNTSTPSSWHDMLNECLKGDASSEVWKYSQLEFAKNNKFRIVKLAEKYEKEEEFQSGDYLFDPTDKLLYLRFADSTNSKSCEMVFRLTYYKEFEQDMKKIYQGKSEVYWQEKIIYILLHKIPEPPKRAKKNLRHWNGVLGLARCVGATWSMPVPEILKCETIDSGKICVRK